MALYAIGDLHLSLGSDKPMEIFGDGWKDYVARIREGFSVLTEDDVTVLCGDLSWGMSLEESLEDFRFIDALPGKASPHPKEVFHAPGLFPRPA